MTDALSNDTRFLLVWLAVTALMLTAVIAALVWAARSGQFKDQQRARSLPLTGQTPDDADATRAANADEHKKG
jgi:cbb3-type cytochrome oxidase maturation protein